MKDAFMIHNYSSLMIYEIKHILYFY